MGSGPNCPGPNCPPLKSGKLGPGQLGPVRGPVVQGPTVQGPMSEAQFASNHQVTSPHIYFVLYLIQAILPCFHIRDDLLEHLRYSK